MSNYTDVKFRIGNYLARYPAIYYGIAKRLFAEKSGQKRVDESVSIIIDGYPRSANTFAYWAFLFAQSQEFDRNSVAHHIHKAAQIIRGIQLNKPTMLLIRKPQDCVTSLLIRQPRITAKSAIMSYCWFYEALAPYADRTVIADFDAVTSDYGCLIESVNAKFGSAFAPFIHTDENVKEVYRLIADAPDALRSKKKNTTSGIAVPSQDRDSRKEQIKSELANSDKLRSWIVRAEKAFHCFVSPVNESSGLSRRQGV